MTDESEALLALLATLPQLPSLTDSFRGEFAFSEAREEGREKMEGRQFRYTTAPSMSCCGRPIIALEEAEESANACKALKRASLQRRGAARLWLRDDGGAGG